MKFFFFNLFFIEFSEYLDIISSPRKRLGSAVATPADERKFNFMQTQGRDSFSNS